MVVVKDVSHARQPRPTGVCPAGGRLGCSELFALVPGLAGSGLSWRHAAEVGRQSRRWLS